MEVKKLLFTIMFLTSSILVYCQNINVNEDYPVKVLFQEYVTINKTKANVKGWRIQLVATTDRRKVEEAKERFQELYPGVNVDWKHVKPYYKLRAGAFLHKLDAMRALQTIKSDFPGAYPANDNHIHPRELLNSTF